jgi:hypothetical protein
MIEEKDRSAIVRLARQYGVHRVFLFGSGAEAGKQAGDIDLGIIGIDPARFLHSTATFFSVSPNRWTWWTCRMTRGSIQSSNGKGYPFMADIGEKVAVMRKDVTI